MRSATGILAATAALAMASADKTKDLIPQIFHPSHGKAWLKFGTWFDDTGRQRVNHERRRSYPYTGARAMARLQRQRDRILAKGGKLPWDQGQRARDYPTP